MDWIWMGLTHAFAMFWATLWALVLGFAISAALQAWVTTERMRRAFGEANFSSMALATLLGAASSSCSYAAVAAARSAFQKGAALIPALAFMFASTNLVAELGTIIWVLLGWQFVVAEIAGAIFLIAFMWLFASFLIKPNLERQARENAIASVEHHGGCCTTDDHGSGHVSAGRGIRRLADAFFMDWRMVWKELLVGFLIAGFLAGLIPSEWWRALFIDQGDPVLRLIVNAAVGPFIAILSFVCSCANIPLASVLWSNGISFGGVISFIYADLLALPLIVIYVKYYGARAAAIIVAILYVSMVLSGIVIELIFGALNLIPQGVRPPPAMEHGMIGCNYTSWLNLVALAVAAWLLLVKLRSPAASKPD